MPEVWHLPGHPKPGEGWREGASAAGVVFRTPRLTRAQAETVAERVRAAALAARGERSIDAVLGAIDRVAARLCDATADGREAVASLSEGLGWPTELAHETLMEAGRAWTREALERLLRTELGDATVLDGYVEDHAYSDVAGGTRRFRRALGPPLLLQVLAANVPGVAVTAIIRGLLARSGVLCKSPRDEPALPALFARLLAEEDPLLGQTVAVTWWPAEDDPWEWQIWSAEADLAVVYGGPEAVAGVRGALPPETELLAYGPRVGIGVVLKPAASDIEAARRLARDVCAYEQRGCVSPRVVFVVGDDVEDFAELLAVGLEEETLRRPPPGLDATEAIAIRSLRAEREFETVELGSATAGIVASDPDLRWTILVDAEPRIDAATLPRVVQLCQVAGVGDLLTALAPLAGHIQAVGYAGVADQGELAEAAARLGACRVAPFGTVAWPPADWRHDGRHQLLPLLRWTDWER